jgi:hypothetical protein
MCAGVKRSSIVHHDEDAYPLAVLNGRGLVAAIQLCNGINTSYHILRSVAAFQSSTARSYGIQVNGSSSAR